VIYRFNRNKVLQPPWPSFLVTR